MHEITCFISHKPVAESQAVKGSDMQDTLFAYIRESYPDFTAADYISRTELEKIRKDYLLHLVAMEDDDISLIQQQVVDAVAGNKVLSEDVEPIIVSHLTPGQRAADHIAAFGGSWKFIILFFLVLVGWIALNAWFLGHKAFDPYPFILMNLILSCLAAVQAPIIMMSQNRQEQKDRLRGENDYKVNLKAELEIKLLHEKIDHLTFIQSKRLFEVQQMQVDYLEDILARLEAQKPSRS